MKPFSDPSQAKLFGQITGVPLDEGKGFGVNEGSFSVKIVDEDSKLNVNLAFRADQKDMIAKELLAFFSPPQFETLFGTGLESDNLVPKDVLVSEMIDWVDPDEDTYGVSGGTEDGFYAGLNPPYERKNAPCDSLEELHMIRGLSDDVWSTFVDPDPTNPDKRMITVWGGDRINVNTAPPGVLLMVICLVGGESIQSECDPNNLGHIISVIAVIAQLRKFGLSFRSVREFIDALKEPIPGFPGVTIKSNYASLYFTTKSNIFSIYATGKVGEIEKRIHAVVDLQGKSTNNSGKIIYWRMD